MLKVVEPSFHIAVSSGKLCREVSRQRTQTQLPLKIMGDCHALQWE